MKFEITWECTLCKEIHHENLLKDIKDVQIEYNLGMCRPDIALLNRKGKVITVIEIVVTHPPEDKVLDYYRINNINFIQINSDLEQDIETLDIEYKMENPDIVRYSKKCNVVNLPNIDESYQINFELPVLLEIEQIESKGVDIDSHENNTENEADGLLFNIKTMELNNVCSQCRYLQPNKLLHVIDGTCWKCNSKMKMATI